MVFEGGGVRGTLYAGALQALQESGHLEGITQFGGTSAGATVAAMLAVGYNACEFREETMGTSFSDLVEFSLFDRLKRAFVGSGTSALARLLGRQKGFYTGHNLESASDKVIAKKLCSIDLNLPLSSLTEKDLEEEEIGKITGGKCSMYRRATFGMLKDFNNGKKTLSISSFDITNGTLVYFNSDTSPNLPISKAIRMSSSIPLIFEPMEHEGHLFVDGCLMRRLPIDAFPADRSMLALKINSDFIPTTPHSLEEMSVSSFIYRILSSMAKQTQDLDIVQKAKKNGVHFVDFSGHSYIRNISPINFDLSELKKAGMFEAGYITMRNYLESKDAKFVPPTSSSSSSSSSPSSSSSSSPSSPPSSPTCVLPFCSTTKNCTWLRNLKLEAIKDDYEKKMKQQYSWIKTCTFGMDPHFALRLCFLVIVCATVSQIVTQSRNGIHKMAVETYSGIRTARCEFCLRSWMPADLAASTIPNLPRDEVKKALDARGIFFMKEENGCLRQASCDSQKQIKMDEETDAAMRYSLQEAVWWENISLRRPWSWLSHSKHVPSVVSRRCGHDCPISINTTIVVLALWLSYIFSVISSA
jgi:predicted acylesterase/phospholipase RssA